MLTNLKPFIDMPHQLLTPTPELINLVRFTMNNKGINEAQLSNLSGVSRRTLKKFLSGHDDVAVQRGTILVICDALNIDEAIALKLQDNNND